MIFNFSGVCRHCAADIDALVEIGRPMEGCPDCGKPPFTLKPLPGLIYILSNPNQIGVKIGLTKKASIEDRLRSLSSPTGVAGKFHVVALFPSNRPSQDEKRVHEKAQKHRLSKEHFNLDPLDALLMTFRALGRRKPIIHDRQIREAFEQRLEDAREEMDRRLKRERG